jgi:hypothetical protein
MTHATPSEWYVRSNVPPSKYGIAFSSISEPKPPLVEAPPIVTPNSRQLAESGRLLEKGVQLLGAKSLSTKLCQRGYLLPQPLYLLGRKMSLDGPGHMSIASIHAWYSYAPARETRHELRSSRNFEKNESSAQ